MPAMADITVKKNDGTTDVVYYEANPAGSDGIPALWRNSSVGSAPAHYPSLELKSRWNGQKTARRVDFAFMYPQIATDSTTGLVSVVNRAIATGSVAIPTNMPLTDLAEFSAQFGNLMSSTLIKACNKNGFAPT